MIIFGTMNLVTFAHGEVYMIGAFVGYFALGVYRLPWPVALASGMAAAWVLGSLIGKTAFRPLRATGHMPPLLITIGLSIILKDLAVVVFGAENRPVPSVYETTIRVAGVPVSVLQLVILGLAATLVVALRLLLQSTKIGRAMRATAQDHEAAYAMGVNVNRVFNIAFALASALGGAAGVMVGIYYNTVYPAMGGTAGLKGFAACIFGGLTSIPGAILGGFIIGVVENLTVQFVASGYRDVVAFVVMVPPLYVDRIFEIIQQLNRDGIGILLVEQNANMALSIAHRGYVLQTGRVVLADRAASLVNHPMMRAAYLEL